MQVDVMEGWVKRRMVVRTICDHLKMRNLALLQFSGPEYSMQPRLFLVLEVSKAAFDS